VELDSVLYEYVGLGCVCCYLVFTSCNISNIGLYISICVSFMCSLLIILYMWYFPLLILLLDMCVIYLIVVITCYFVLKRVAGVVGYYDVSLCAFSVHCKF
jgi:hypothetical protein